MKNCSKCGVEQPLSEYYKNIRNKDGMDCRCKGCAKIYNASKLAYDKGVVKIHRGPQAKRQNFIVKHGKDMDDIINGPHEERHELSEFFD